MKVERKKKQKKNDMSKNNKKKNRSGSRERIVEEFEREDKLQLYGVVEEALPGTWFRVKITEGGNVILATLSGKLRQNHIHILPGDSVMVEVSPYDTSRGRISWRR